MDSTTSSTQSDSTVAESTETNVEYAKGSWQEQMSQSTVLLDRSTKARRRASSLLWEGSKSAIETWLESADTDVAGEGLYDEVLGVLGKPRKGDASKVKTVALAVKDNGLVLSVHPNLSKAYAEAVRLTKTKATQKAEDDAAEKAIEALAEQVPNSTTTVEGAALILLGKGVDGAVVAILDALGKTNFDAHRAFIRAVSVEVSARVQAAKPKPVAKKAATPKKNATTAKKASPKQGSTKAKPVPTSKSKGDPNKKALPAKKATPVAVKAKPQPAEMSVEDVAEETSTAPVKATPVVVKR